MTNCGPVSLLTFLCKVFKKAMYSGVSQFLDTNNKLVLGKEY